MNIKYDFKKIEKDRYKNWLKKDLFKTENNLQKKPFTIVMPPPNITGKLHLGHAWNNILQDIIIRRKKMLGFDVLFLPGMDHAGIATQSKIKEKLKKDGFSEKLLTREIFLKYAFLWKETYSSSIRRQWASLGLSLDYNYEKFTFDPSLNEVVLQVFIDLYNQNLIYRDYKIINWDPLTQTNLSNVEVNYREVQGKLFYLKYFFVNPQDLKKYGFISVATTRLETIFADQALMVNPDDKRYQHLIGKKVFIPNTDIIIPIISDISVQITFGTGVVKVTPAHDENDFQMSKKYHLKLVSCINPNGTMNSLAKEYQNLDLFECRQQLSQTLEQKNFLIKTEKHIHFVGFSSISGAVIDPRPSLQWFLKTKKLAQKVLKMHDIDFFPQGFLKIFNTWLKGMEDWCISRQLWWGHPIPVWYKGEKIKVQKEDPGNNFMRDPDVLDTWFSSSLWPLSTLGWGQNENFFQRRFPADILVTGYDILTFWVSKMVLQSIHFTKKTPFKQVLLHGLVKDSQGYKMSKSKGNGIDPSEIILHYGADTLRWFLSTNVSAGNDLFFNKNQLIASSHFINKLWNISLFIKLNVQINQVDFDENNLFLYEKALLTKLSQLVAKINFLHEKYEFHLVGSYLYQFIWEDFSNWTLEFSKIILKNNKNTLNTQKFLFYVFENIIKLLHPFVPFITDAIYEEIISNKKNILQCSWPKINYLDLKALDDFESLKSLIIEIRRFRKLYEIETNDLLKLYIESPEETSKSLEFLTPILKVFLKVNDIEFQISFNIKKYYLLCSKGKISFFINKEVFQKFNIRKNKENMKKQIEKLQVEIKRSKNLLSNLLFLQKANLNKIQEEKDKYAKYLSQYNKLKSNFDFKK